MESPSSNNELPLLGQIKAALPELRNSERKVAQLVLDAPADIAGYTMAAVADAANVSEPTVMRFTQKLGFEGFQAFKVGLTRALALGVPVTYTGIDPEDSPQLVAQKVFDHTIASLDLARRTYESERISEAVAVLVDAREIVFIGFGASNLIAQDAVQKSGLFGVPCSAPADVHQQVMAASMCGPGTVFFLISNTGRTATVLHIAQIARANGATVIGLTGAVSPLAELCDVPLIIKTYEDTDVLTPTVSRLAGLVMIDVLSTAVSAARGPEHLGRVRAMKQELTSFRSVDEG